MSRLVSVFVHPRWRNRLSYRGYTEDELHPLLLESRKGAPKEVDRVFADACQVIAIPSDSRSMRHVSFWSYVLRIEVELEELDCLFVFVIMV